MGSVRTTYRESFVATLIALGMVFVSLVAGVAVLSLPFWLLALLFRKPVRVRRGEWGVKDEVVRAQWEWDRLWNRRK